MLRAIAFTLFLWAGASALAEPGPLTAKARELSMALEQRVVYSARQRTELEGVRREIQSAKRSPVGAGQLQALAERAQALKDEIDGLEKQVEAEIPVLRAAIEEALAKEGDHVPLLRQLARITGLRGEGRATLDAMSRAVTLEPDSAELRLERAVYAEKAMNYELALADYEFCHGKGYRVAQCEMERIRCLVWTHQFERALTLLDELLPKLPPREKASYTDLRQMTADFVDHWKREQELRAAEAAKDDLPRVKLVTSKGEILLELFEDQAPNTVAQFITLVESGFYTNTRFHRKIHEFMVQGGCPNTRNLAAADTHGKGHAGYFIPDELGQRCRMHFAGTLTMANTGDVDTNSSQFMITYVPAGWLNVRRHAKRPPEGHTVFGRVLTGLDVAKELEVNDELVRAEVLRKRAHGYEIARKVPVR